VLRVRPLHSPHRARAMALDDPRRKWLEHRVVRVDVGHRREPLRRENVLNEHALCNGVLT